jgi:acyl-CoA reductase-like NAD-dependent aldehyde dehydrogenase
MEARQVALQSRSPQRPDDLVVEVEEAGAVAVDQAVGLARKAADGWAAASALERSTALVAAADALAGAAGEVTSLVVRRLVSARLDTGMIRVNAPTTGVDFLAPFGGEKDSSYGPREQGKAAKDLYTSTRTITINPMEG